MRSFPNLVGRGRWVVGLSALGAAAACDTLAEPPPPETPPVLIEASGSSGFFPGGGGSGGGGGQTFDSRPVVVAEKTPPPISGGTLLVLKAGGRAVVADADRDVVSVVDLGSRTVEVTFPLDARAEPGRLVEDANGRVHVVLRNTGELLTIDTNVNAAVDRRAACRAPRGVAYEASSDRVLVACQEGTLVELPAGEGEVLRTTLVAQDLRDVVLADGQVVLTRFRAAELVYLDAARNVTKRVTPPGDALGFASSVAWRAITTPEGGVAVTHQRAFAGVIEVGGGGSGGSGIAGAGGEASGADPLPPEPTRSGYGEPSQPCSSVVQSTVTFADKSGGLVVSPRLDRMVLPVDIALSAGKVAVANGGVNQFFGGPSVGLFRRTALLVPPEGCATTDFVEAPGEIVAVAFDPVSGTLYAQSREPAQLLVMDETGQFLDSVVELSGTSAFDTGHEIFHADTGGGIACASCHPEGAEDGNVWRFAGFGERRTQPLDVGLEGTAPFHWEGDLPTFSHLILNVFRDRMGGPMETPEREAALESYVYELPRRSAVRDVEDAAAVRGKALFESTEVGCMECHSGPKLSNGKTENIGREVALQVPSLIAVSARAPYMHDGCAETLLDRFDPVCGGSRHGRVEGLEASDLDDLVAYLETL